MDQATNASALPAPGCWWILPRRLLAGPAAAADLLRKGEWIPERVLDLREEAHSSDAQALHLPVKDFSLPPAELILQGCLWVEQGLAVGQRVFLHCQAGCGRSGLLAGALLLRQGLSAGEVLERLSSLRRAAGLLEACPETGEQRDWLERGAPGLPIPRQASSTFRP